MRILYLYCIAIFFIVCTNITIKIQITNIWSQTSRSNVLNICVTVGNMSPSYNSLIEGAHIYHNDC